MREGLVSIFFGSGRKAKQIETHAQSLKSDRMAMTYGVPQVSIPGPLLYCYAEKAHFQFKAFYLHDPIFFFWTTN